MGFFTSARILRKGNFKVFHDFLMKLKENFDGLNSNIFEKVLLEFEKFVQCQWELYIFDCLTEFDKDKPIFTSLFEMNDKFSIFKEIQSIKNEIEADEKYFNWKF